jgi:RimJ/RimL family protein N-acetyltransferase
MRTRRLRLRPLTRRDAKAIAALAGDWDVARMTGRIPHPYRIEDALQWVDETDAESAYGIVYRFRLVGICGYMANGQTEAELGYWIGKPWWGRGIATEAVGRLIAHCREIGFTRITCGHFVDNPASKRVIEKLGFVPDGEDQRWCEARNAFVPVMTYHLPAANAPDPRAQAPARQDVLP